MDYRSLFGTAAILGLGVMVIGCHIVSLPNLSV